MPATILEGQRKPPAPALRRRPVRLRRLPTRRVAPGRLRPTGPGHPALATSTTAAKAPAPAPSVTSAPAPVSPLAPRTHRRRRNSARVNLIFSLVFHAFVVAGLFLVAAREGILGNKLREIAVVIVPKDKPAEQPKQKEPEPQRDQEEEPEPETQAAPVTVAPPVAQTARVAPPAYAPVAAPAAVIGADFSFSDGAKVTTSDPVQAYQGYIESSIRSRWIRPDNLDDASYIAEVDVGVDPQGKLNVYEWRKTSGNRTWDDSVRTALDRSKTFGKPPPRRFPPRFSIRFDVQEETDALTLE